MYLISDHILRYYCSLEVLNKSGMIITITEVCGDTN